MERLLWLVYIKLLNQIKKCCINIANLIINKSILRNAAEEVILIKFFYVNFIKFIWDYSYL